MSELRKIEIDGKLIEVEPELTLIQACEEAGVEIPRFCYHERLSIAGNCRMCLVEIVGAPPKPAASCAIQVKDLMPGPNKTPPKIRTNSSMVKKAREGVMEFLLINHPLDCPICDQGGECDLQDQAMAYGVDFSRYQEPKRAVNDLNLGPLVETHMTRCISCTRCVRFTNEVAGNTQMGQTGRGEDAEITSYLSQTLNSNLQGNIIDLCPVGALTSKPYAFTARPWELSKTETIDVMDALGSNIRVDSKGREVMRIIPRNHDAVNEEWISDTTRFAWDGLRLQRLDKPYLRHGKRLEQISWNKALKVAAKALKAKSVSSLAGDLAPLESIYALGLMTDSLKGRKECRTDGAALPVGNRSGYVGTACIEDIDEAESIIIVGSNPRNEAPVLNARIRTAWMHGSSVGVFGSAADLTYSYQHLGNNTRDFEQYVDNFDNQTKPFVLVGQSALTSLDGAAVLAAAQELGAHGGGMLILHTAASRVGAMDINFTNPDGIDGALEGVDTVYCLGVDEIDIPQGPFVIYQGAHGDRGANRANLILPSAVYTEESGTFVNTEGRPQLAAKATFPPGEAKQNWAIIRAISGVLGAALPFKNVLELRSMMYSSYPHLGQFDVLPVNELDLLPRMSFVGEEFKLLDREFYLSNPILRASPLMGELASQSIAAGTENALAA